MRAENKSSVWYIILRSAGAALSLIVEARVWYKNREDGFRGREALNGPTASCAHFCKQLMQFLRINNRDNDRERVQL